MSKVRLKDVAAELGLSTATVSLVLNDAEHRFPPSTVERVRRTAEKMGYAPNTAARTLRTNRTRTLGVIAERILTTPFGFDMVHGAQEAAMERGYMLLIVGTEGDEQSRHEAAEALVARQVDGILFGSMYHRISAMPDVPRMPRSVGFNTVIDGVECYVPDDFGGAKAATELLVAAGHRKIAHITEFPTDGLAREQRINGFLEVTKANGIKNPPVLSPTSSSTGTPSEPAEELALTLLQGTERPTAIFAFSDLMAMGVYRAANSLGLRIPEDLSIVGFDNQRYVASELRPGLTTIQLPHYELARLATDSLLDQLSPTRAKSRPAHQDSDTPDRIIDPGQLIERGSVAPPRG